MQRFGGLRTIDIPRPPFKVKRSGRRGEQKFTLVHPPLSMSKPVFYFKGDIQDAQNAVAARILGVYTKGEFLPPIFPTRQAWKVNDLARFLMRHLSTAAPLSLDEVCLRFTGAKRVAYQEAAADITPLSPEDLVLRNFLKIEAYEKLETYPRIIRERNKKATAHFGTVIYAIQGFCKKLLDRWFKEQFGVKSKVVLSGMGRDELAAHAYAGIMSVPNFVIIRLDGVRFDFHVSKESIVWTQKIYSVVRCSSEARNYMKWRLTSHKNYMRARDGRFKYEAPISRASGDPDTWLGNTLIACNILNKFCRDLRNAGCHHMYVADTSDDIGLAVPQEWATLAMDLIVRAGTHFGFRLEPEVVSRDYRRFSWMQSFLLYDAAKGKARYIRDIPRAMQRIFCTHKPVHNTKYYFGWCSAVGICTLFDFGDVPLLRAAGLWLLKRGRGHTPVALDRWDVDGVTIPEVLVQEIAADAKLKPHEMAEARARRLLKFEKLFAEPSIDMYVAVAHLYGWTREFLDLVESELLTEAVVEPVLEDMGPYDAQSRYQLS